MQDLTLDKGKAAMALAGLFCLFAVYAAVTEFKLPSDAQAVEPAQVIVELDPVNIQQLTQTHLFGQPPQAVAKVDNAELMDKRRRDAENRRKLQQQQQAKARPVNINVTVTGLLASNDADFSAAVLKVDNKPEKLYRVGEDLGKPEVRLESVDRDSVVIDNNGNTQIIAIKRPELVSGTGQNSGGRVNNQQSLNQGFNEIPEIPPELQLPEELDGLNNAAYGGAYSPPLPDPVEFEPVPGSIPEDIQEQMLQDQLQAEFNLDMNGEPEMEQDDHGSFEEPPSPELNTDPNSPDFQMPVF